MNPIPTRDSPVLAVVAVVLWLCAGCVIPPPEYREQDNLPPRIDWNRTIPAHDEPIFDRTSDEVMEFSIADAVEDPEGDQYHELWYWVGPDGIPVAEYGSGVMQLRPCDHRKLANLSPGQYVVVKVLVSSSPLRWTGDPETLLPVVIPEDQEVARRVWYLKLVGECR